MNKAEKGRKMEVVCQKEYIAYVEQALNNPTLIEKWRATRNIIKTKSGFFAFQNDFLKAWDLTFLYKEQAQGENADYANILHFIQVKKGYEESIYNELQKRKPYGSKAYLAVYQSEPRDKEVSIKLPHFWLIEV